MEHSKQLLVVIILIDITESYIQPVKLFTINYIRYPYIQKALKNPTIYKSHNTKGSQNKF